MKTICFTGHRPKKLCGYDKNSYAAFVNEMRGLCEKFYNEGYTNFITGGAQGVDQLAFWAVNRLKAKHPDIKNIVYLPFDDFGSQWLEKGLFSRTDLNLIKSIADEIKIVSPNPENKRDAIAKLMNRNHTMVENSDLVIAVYPDHNWSLLNQGGTAEYMRYAVNNNKTVCHVFYDTTPVMHILNCRYCKKSENGDIIYD